MMFNKKKKRKKALKTLKELIEKLKKTQNPVEFNYNQLQLVTEVADSLMKLLLKEI